MNKLQLQTALSVLNQITEKSGAGSQAEILSLLADNDNEHLRYLLQVAYSPFIVTGIREVEVVDEITFSEYSFDKLVQTISSRSALTDELRNEVFLFVNSYDFDRPLREILAKILTKSLNIGIGAKTINKAFGEKFLPVSEVMLAVAEDKEDISKWSDDYYIAEFKENGNRMVTRIKGKQISFYTRNFKQLDNVSLSNVEKSIRKAFEGLIDKDSDFFFDGEIVHLNDITDEGRKIIGGLFNKIIKGTGFEGIDKEFTYRIFDWEFNDTLENGIGSLTYEERRNSGIFDLIKQANLPNLQQRDPWIVESVDEISEIYRKVLDMGGEGLIIKRKGHKYELKRSKNWVKMKDQQECDLVITGILEGKSGTKREKVGKLSCESACGKLRVNVGSGLSDEQIDLIERNPQDYIGKIVTILYNVRINNKNEGESLFLPRFQRNSDGLITIRYDKDVANTIEEIN